MACRMHRHHLKAGRKGRRRDGIEDDESELSDTTDASNSPSPSAITGGAGKGPQEQSPKFNSPPQNLAVRPAPSQPQRLPNFETFIRNTFPDSTHRRTASAPQNNANVATATWSSDSRSTSFPANDSRHVRTQSGRPQNNTSQSYQSPEERPAYSRRH
ncbi:hypothetical protein LTS17_000179 [Exophiala oligosperma]